MAMAQIRTRETNLGNLVCDALREHMKADVALVQAGTFRGDDVRVHVLLHCSESVAGADFAGVFQLAW